MKPAFYLKMNFEIIKKYVHQFIPLFIGDLDVLKCKQIVNRQLYSQIAVSIVLLISACTSNNKFEEDAIRQVQTFADERKADAVLTYFTHDNWKVREQAAMAFGSMHDSLGIENLLKLAELDKSSDVRAAAAFSLGQFKMRGLRNIIVRLLNEESDEVVKRELIIAVGRSLGADILTNRIKTADNYEKASIAEGIFYALANGDTLINKGSEVIELLNVDGDASFYAAAALNRSKLDFSNDQKLILDAFNSNEDINTRFQLAILIGNSQASNQNLLLDLFNKEEHYLVRLGLIQGNSKSDSLKSHKLLSEGIIDKSAHIRQKSAEEFLSYKSLPPGIDLLMIAKKELMPLTKYTAFEAALKHSSSIEQKIQISEQLNNELLKTKDEYVTGWILKALCAWEANLKFVEEFCFKSTSILIRGKGLEALISSYQLKKSPSDINFNNIIIRGLKTKDVTVSAMCAEAVLDLATYRSANNTELIELLESALNSMRLPRDIESYTSLLKAIRFLENKPISGQLKPEYNNPIDWELTSRIPINQQIKFTTVKGEVIVELWVDEAPGSVTQFVKLIKSNFYTKKRLHRVVPGFVIQDGCPRGDGFGSTMETVRSEFWRTAKFDEGTLGFASAGEDTESCQWFITHTRTPHLNGRYTAFGKVIEGMDIIHDLLIGDGISSIELLAP